MSVHGHANTKTIDVCTQGVNRQKLATEAMRLMASIRRESWDTRIATL